jgi:hypothetical protein
MAQLYCFVENNAVTQGPMQLPFSSGNITGLPLAPDPTIYGWYPYTDPGAPPINSITQSITTSFAIDGVAKTVTQAYTVNDLTDIAITTRRNDFFSTALQSINASLARLQSSSLIGNTSADYQTKLAAFIQQIADFISVQDVASAQASLLNNEIASIEATMQNLQSTDVAALDPDYQAKLDAFVATWTDVKTSSAVAITPAITPPIQKPPAV